MSDFSKHPRHCDCNSCQHLQTLDFNESDNDTNAVSAEEYYRFDADTLSFTVFSELPEQQ